MRLVSLVALAALTSLSLAHAATKPKPSSSAMATPAASDWRTVDAENTLVIDTTKGRIIVELAPSLAPAHVQRIKELTRQGFYNGLKFHRVIDTFMAQTGDPLGTGLGGSTLPDLTAEFTFRRSFDENFDRVNKPVGAELGFMGSSPVASQPDDIMMMTADGKAAAWGMFCPGVLGMARGDDPNSANSQFFLMRQAYPALDKRYTPLGRTVVGLSVVRALKEGEPVIDPDVMTKVQMLADIPSAQRPKVQVLSTASAYFTGLVDHMKAQKGADFSICDLELPSQVK
jgi:peptidylprolyl isomerase